MRDGKGERKLGGVQMYNESKTELVARVPTGNGVLDRGSVPEGSLVKQQAIRFIIVPRMGYLCEPCLVPQPTNPDKLYLGDVVEISARVFPLICFMTRCTKNHMLWHLRKPYYREQRGSVDLVAATLFTQMAEHGYTTLAQDIAEELEMFERKGEHK
jgi:hypothetical protein